LFLRIRPRPMRRAISCASGWGKDLDPSMTSWRPDLTRRAQSRWSHRDAFDISAIMANIHE
jgi:hypothetical protein